MKILLYVTIHAHQAIGLLLPLVGPGWRQSTVIRASPQLPIDLPFILEVSYDGTGFDGWQDASPQNNDQTTEESNARKARTVQHVLEQKIQKIYGGRDIKLRAASRTDAGVHSRGQVCSFTPPQMTEKTVILSSSTNDGFCKSRGDARPEPQGGDPTRLAAALNRLLPADVRVGIPFSMPSQINV